MSNLTHLNRRRPGETEGRARLAEVLWTIVAALNQAEKVAEEYGCLDIRDAVRVRIEDLYALGGCVEAGGPLPEEAMVLGGLLP